MNVHLYTIAWNEADLLGFFFRHYDPWVDRYVIYDNGSTDETLNMLHAHPRVEVRQFERVDPDSFVFSHTHMQDNCWKESRGHADWVVITAIDEHLHVPEVPMADYLAGCRRKGTTLVPALGFNAISNEFPEPDEWLCQTRRNVCAALPLCKLSIFNPNEIRETQFGNGRHHARPTGRTKLPRKDELLLLHYKHLDSDRVFQRHQFEQTGLGVKDREHKFGEQYFAAHEAHVAMWDEMLANAVDFAAPGFDPVKHHRGNRWWRMSWKLKRRLRRVRAPMR